MFHDQCYLHFLGIAGLLDGMFVPAVTETAVLGALEVRFSL